MFKAQWLRVGFGMFLIAFGANLFAPLLPAYRAEAGLSQPEVTFLLAFYAVGLVPALLIGGPLSDKLGRRSMMKPALVLSFLGSVVLAIGANGSIPILATGRFIVGVAIGLIMASGAAWLAELSEGPTYVGARRATVSLSAGFGLGPLMAGMLAEFLPHPDLLPYLVHLVLMIVCVPFVWSPAGGLPPETAVKRSLVPRSVLSARFFFTVAAWAPWGFGVVTTSFATLTALSNQAVEWPVAYGGVITAITLLTGVFIQPLATRFGSDLVPPAILGLGLVVAGMGLAILVALTHSPWAAVPAALTLGAAYGTMMVSGLREVRRMSAEEDLGAATGIFYSLTYVGFFAPFILAYLGPKFGYVPVFVFGALVAALSIIPITLLARSNASRRLT